MNKLGPWLKGNWVILLLALLALAVIPTAYYFAGSMRAKVRDELQKKVDADMKDLTNVKVQVHLMSVTGDKVLEKNMEPNPAVIAWYADEWEKIRSRTGEVSEAALAFNKGDHAVLIQGLFPDPESFGAEAKRREFAAAFVRDHPQLLAGIGASVPRSPASIAAQLGDYQQAQLERIKNQTGKDATEEEKARLADELRAQRIREYQLDAARITVYAGIDVFEGVPATPPTAVMSIAQCWDWQERYWIHQDICRAIALANADNSGGGVPQSVVKRIIRIAVGRAPYTSAEGAPLDVIPTETGTDKAPMDYSRSITGRVSGPGSNNRWYDVRTVRVELIVSSRRLPALFDALAATNFMTVLDFDLYRVDPIDELRAGHYYGEDDPVVRAVLNVESIWLREWRQDLMPLDVRKALGMVEGITVDEFGFHSAPAPAPAPNRGRGDDDDLSVPRGRGAGGGG